MATANPFELLGDDDNEDPAQLIVAAQQQQQQKDSAPAKKVAAVPKKAPLQPTQAKLPSKPLPPAQAVREAKNELGSGRGSGHGSGGGRGFYRDSSNNENSFKNEVAFSGAGDEDSMKHAERGHRSYGGSRGSFRGGRRGALNNEEMRERDQLRRQFERHSGIKRGTWIKGDGFGAGHWGTPTDDIAQVTEESVNANYKNLENQLDGLDTAGADKEATANELEGKEAEDKEMTLVEYEKVLEEKRKALKASKSEERKVDPKEFECMQQLSSKKDNDDVFIKLGSEKDKQKEIADKEEKAKKAVSINEFLKPAEGTKYYGGRSWGRGGHGGRFGGSNMMNKVAAPSIEDRGQFPILGAD